ncbi:MAG TPA: hypothetical protein VFR05_02295 [Terriglobia bacterium]|nr:hypothetical protein [Terriglobia bacterium]
MAKQTNLQKYGHLPRYVEQESPNQKKINEHKAKYSTLSTSELAQAYTRLRDEKDDIEEELKALNQKLEAATAILIERLEEEELLSLRTHDGYLVSAKFDPYASVKDKEAFRAWVIDNGYENLLTLPWQTTNAIAKALLESGEAPPTGVEVYLKPGLRLARS